MATFNLEKVASGIALNAGKFAEAVLKYDELSKGALFELDLQLTAKQAELSQLEKDYQVKLKDFKIELTQSVNAEELKTAEEIAKKHTLSLIRTSELEALRKDLQGAIFDKAVLVKTTTEEITKKCNASKERALKVKDLEHGSAVATINAENTQLANQIKFLKDEQTRMVAELNEMRKLVQSVADSKKGDIIVNERNK